jgi:predicted xylose isomerase-like sugar epimerase
MHNTFTPTQKVLSALAISEKEAFSNPKKVIFAASKKLQSMGYVRKMNHMAWERGMRWFAPNASTPMENADTATILAYALNK